MCRENILTCASVYSSAEQEQQTHHRTDVRVKRNSDALKARHCTGRVRESRVEVSCYYQQGEFCP